MIQGLNKAENPRLPCFLCIAKWFNRIGTSCFPCLESEKLETLLPIILQHESQPKLDNELQIVRNMRLSRSISSGINLKSKKNNYRDNQV